MNQSENSSGNFGFYNKYKPTSATEWILFIVVIITIISFYQLGKTSGYDKGYAKGCEDSGYQGKCEEWIAEQVLEEYRMNSYTPPDR